MSTVSAAPIEDKGLQNSMESIKPAGKLWLAALLPGLAFAWPLLCAAAIYGPQMMIRSIGGDAYHYLAIARKAVEYHIYTYDGVTVTNGFHPLWEYTVRAVFQAFHLQTHESQAIALMVMALLAGTLGVMIAGAAVIRLTNRYFLAFLIVPGLYYLTIGVHVGSNWIWSVLDGMESSFSLLFGGIFFLVLSFYMGSAAKGKSDLYTACRALGIVLPFVILSRLDDFFLLPAFLIAILLTDRSLKEKFLAGAWIAAPSAFCILCYLIYNRATVGVAMPLSGGTKAGFVGFISAYQTAAIHFPPLFNLKMLVTKSWVDATLVLSNSYRQLEVVYPFIIACFALWAVWRYKRNQPEFPLLFALCLYIPFKMSYNFLEVNVWHQDVWYFQFALLTLSVLGALALERPWKLLDRVPVAKSGIVTVYVLLMMLSASQYYASIVYRSADNITIQFWNRKDEIRRQLVAQGVHGIVNFDDGITAFLLDFPNMHGFAYATDVTAQRAFREGHMLSLAYARGINTIAGIGYLSTNAAPQSQAEIRQYLSNPLVAKAIQGDLNNYDFSLAYYDPALKMSFILFRPKSGSDIVKPLQ